MNQQKKNTKKSPSAAQISHLTSRDVFSRHCRGSRWRITIDGLNLLSFTRHTHDHVRTASSHSSHDTDLAVLQSAGFSLFFASSSTTVRTLHFSSFFPDLLYAASISFSFQQITKLGGIRYPLVPVRPGRALLHTQSDTWQCETHYVSRSLLVSWVCAALKE